MAPSATPHPGAFLAASGVGLLITNIGAGGVNIIAPGGTVIGASSGIDITTANGGILVQNLASVQANNGAGIRAITGGGGISISGIGQITATGFDGIIANSFGGALSVANNSSVTGSTGITARSLGGALSITSNGNITGTSSTGVSASSTGGGLTIANNGNMTGNLIGLNVSSGGGLLSITGNGNITGVLFEGIIAFSGGGGLIINGNGNITGRTEGIVADSGGGGIGITTGGTVTGLTASGITTNSGIGSQMLQLNHNVTGATHGLDLTSTGVSINVTNLAILTGGANAIRASANVVTILNPGTINGDINVTTVSPTFSGMNNTGTWNTGTGNSTIGGALANGGTLNAQNGIAQQTINIGFTYSGSGAVRLDLGDRLVIGNTATLGAGSSLNVALAPNSLLAHSNVVLTSAGLTGTFTTTALNIPNVQTATVVYTATDVLVNISGAQLGNGTNLNQNQQNIATALNNAFNAGANLPAGVGGCSLSPVTALGNALTQFSGEVRPASSRQPTCRRGCSSMPCSIRSSTGRGGANSSARRWAMRRRRRRGWVAAREAFAAGMPVKARPNVAVEPRWSVWGAAYGGANRTDGDAVVGSNDLDARAYGIAGGRRLSRVARHRDRCGGRGRATPRGAWPTSATGNSNVGRSAAMARRAGTISTSPPRWRTPGTRSRPIAPSPSPASTSSMRIRCARASADGWKAATATAARTFGLTPYAAVQVQACIRRPMVSRIAGANQFALSYHVADHDRHPQRARRLGRHARTCLPTARCSRCAAAPPGCTTTIPAAASMPRSRRCRARASWSTAPPRRATRR